MTTLCDSIGTTNLRKWSFMGCFVFTKVINFEVPINPNRRTTLREPKTLLYRQSLGTEPGLVNIAFQKTFVFNVCFQFLSLLNRTNSGRCSGKDQVAGLQC